MCWNIASCIEVINLQKTLNPNIIVSGGTCEYRLFRCSSCGKGYKQLGSLNRHQRYECGKLPQFQCPLCVSRFKHKHHLVEHLTIKHKQVHKYDRNVEKP